MQKVEWIQDDLAVSPDSIYSLIVLLEAGKHGLDLLDQNDLGLNRCAHLMINRRLVALNLLLLHFLLSLLHDLQLLPCFLRDVLKLNSDSPFA